MADYDITIPITKSERDGRWIIKGRAAGLGVDKENQVLRPVAIQRLAKQINDHPIPFKDHHLRNSIAEDLGYLISATVSEDFDLDVEVELDKKHPTSKWLWESLDDNKQFGMSIQGNSNEFRLEKEDGKTVLAVYDVNLNEVSATTRPMWSPSFGTVVKKAIDAETSNSFAEGISMDPEDVVVDETTAVDEVPQPEAEVTSAPEIVAPETDPVVIEKAVSADTAKDERKLTKLVTLVGQLNTLLTELGIAVEEPAVTDSVAEALPVEKSDSAPAADDRLVKLETALQETTAKLEEQAQTIEILKSQIPDTPLPGVLIRKSAADELRETFATMDPRQRLRAGLAALHNETEKLR
jgi:hypothetical protein